MTRFVRGKDERIWTVQSRINWSQPATAEQFEHDMAAGYVSGVAMLVVVVALVLFVLVWTPAGVVMPPWLVLSLLLVLMVAAMQWMLKRPWTIVADTPRTGEKESEHWVGTAHGMMAARQDTRQVVQNLEKGAMPDDGTGPLQKIT
jgi:hypothetical protein